MKHLSRVIGIDDGPHEKHKRGKCIIIGTVMRGSEMIDGIVSTHAEVDGTDATGRIISMLNSSHFRTLLKCVFLDGIAVGGFNVIDIRELHAKTGIPVIVIMRNPPDMKAIKRALGSAGMAEKYSMITGFPEIEKSCGLFIQRVGVEREEAGSILKQSIRNSLIPEALRLSHIIASGVVLGHSKGDA